MCQTCFNRYRLALDGAHSGLARQLVLLFASCKLFSHPSKQFIVTSSGAHDIKKNSFMYLRANATDT